MKVWHSIWEEFNILQKNTSQYISLPEILQARENRALRQEQLYKQYDLPLICLTLNIPGAVKQFPLARQSFDEASRLIRRQLERAKAEIVSYEEKHERTGSEGYFVVRFPAKEIKRLMVAIEEGNELGRIFDIDVLAIHTEKISREDIGFPARSCLLCGAPGKVCARSHGHGIHNAIIATLQLMRQYFDGKFAGKISSFAIKSLLYEVCTTPKPGLVDRNNTGSHSDMDMFTFIESTSALVPYFTQCTLFGIRSSSLLLSHLRYIGMNAEDSMYTATNGINTHKGAIFLLGILCAAAGRLYAEEKEYTPDNLCHIGAEIAAPLAEECQMIIKEQNAKTHGEKLLIHGIKGARGEALSGFASVRNISLPVLENRLLAKDSAERAGVIALLHLMAKVIDTNAITRTGITRQEEMRNHICNLLQQNPLPDEKSILQLDEDYIKEHCSPGGCADLLAVTWFLHFVARA